jgi:hypothetical protein
VAGRVLPRGMAASLADGPVVSSDSKSCVRARLSGLATSSHLSIFEERFALPATSAETEG